MRSRCSEHTLSGMPDLSSLGASSGGVWTRPQALAVAPPGQVRAALSRHWQVVWPGTYADAGYVLDPEQRAWAAVLASGGAGQPVPCDPDVETGPQRRRLRAVACGRTAARCWGIPLIDDDDPATGGCERLVDEVSVWAHSPPLRHGGRVLRRHRLRLHPGDIVRTGGGCFVTSPLRTLVDCCALLAPEAAVCALDHALHRGLVTRSRLDEAVAVRHGLPGSAGLRTAVGRSDARAESPVETLTRLLLLPVLPTLEPQVELCDEHGRVVARFDLADRTRKLAVESDGKAAHSGPAMVAKDRARDRRTERYGWWTERVTWYDARRRQAETVERVVARAHRLDEARTRSA